MEECKRCHICYDLLDNINILPSNEDYFGVNFSIFKNTYIVKTIDNCEFLYFFLCNGCIDKYLSRYSTLFKYITQRELGYNK